MDWDTRVDDVGILVALCSGVEKMIEYVFVVLISFSVVGAWLYALME